MQKFLAMGIKIMRYLALGWFMHIEAQVVVLENSMGENFVIEVETKQPFFEVIETIKQSFASIEIDDFVRENLNLQMELKPTSVPIQVKNLTRAVAVTRIYAAGFDEYKEDIAYIIRTLGNASLIQIQKAEPSLKKKGNKIDRVHPLQFLLAIFLDEELKVCVHNIKKRNLGLVWNSFIDGITTSLGQEHAIDNVLPFVPDFAARLNIDANLIRPYLVEQKWTKFVSTLIDIVPRKGERGRYGI